MSQIRILSMCARPLHLLPRCFFFVISFSKEPPKYIVKYYRYRHHLPF